MSGVYFLNMKNKKGFTIVEVMIVVVIIGLVAAMAIPAFQKIRLESISKKVRAGEFVSKEEFTYYVANKAKVEAPEKVEPPKTVEINGVTYRLVPVK